MKVEENFYDIILMDHFLLTGPSAAGVLAFIIVENNAFLTDLIGTVTDHLLLAVAAV